MGSEANHFSTISQVQELDRQEKGFHTFEKHPSKDKKVSMSIIIDTTALFRCYQHELHF